ncbi:MAG: hypothetical protein Q9167_005555 [Letrouitia subvulpina]
MIPPLSPTLQASNPKFARLYTHIVSTFLNPDGSLRLSPTEADAQAQTEQSLQELQSHNAQLLLLKDSLLSLLATSPSLTDAQKDLILLLCSPSPSPFPSPYLPSNAADLLEPLTAQISHALIATATTLTSAFPLPQELETKSRTAARGAQLRTAQLALTDQAAQLSALNRDICSTAIGVLEGAKFGGVARAVDARAVYLERVAEGMAWKARVKALEARERVYDEDVVEALGNYHRHVERYRESLDARAQDAEERLEAYQGAGGRAMAEIVAEMGRLREEVKTVRGEMERLGG